MFIATTTKKTVIVTWYNYYKYYSTGIRQCKEDM